MRKMAMTTPAVNLATRSVRDKTGRLVRGSAVGYHGSGEVGVGWLARVATAAPIGLGLSGESVDAGGWRSRLAADDAQLVVFATGEQHGVLAPCGCGSSPLGGLARTEGYLAAAREALGSRPSLVVDAGAWLDPTHTEDDRALRADAALQNAATLSVVAGWDALNVTFHDLPHLAQTGFPRAAVSANLRGGTAGPAPVIHLTRGGVRIAVTGVSGVGLRRFQPAGYRWDDPVASLAALLPTLDADLVVVLGYGLGAAAARVAALPGVDLFVEAGDFGWFEQPTRVGDAVWSRTWTGGQRLTELRLRLAGGQVVGAVDRSVALDPRMVADRATRRLERRTAAELAVVRARLATESGPLEP
jgi:hypothetical protein